MKKIILILLVLVTFSGCTAALAPILGGAGMIAEGYIIWKDGEATKYYNTDLETTYRAVKHAAVQLNLRVVTDKHDPSPNGYSLIVGEKDKFKVKVVPAKENITRVSIRINFMGDKPYAELFYKTIDDNLNIIHFQNGKPVKEREHRIINKIIQRKANQ